MGHVSLLVLVISFTAVAAAAQVYLQQYTRPDCGAASTSSLPGIFTVGICTVDSSNVKYVKINSINDTHWIGSVGCDSNCANCFFTNLAGQLGGVCFGNGNTGVRVDVVNTSISLNASHSASSSCGAISDSSTITSGSCVSMTGTNSWQFAVSKATTTDLLYGFDCADNTCRSCTYYGGAALGTCVGNSTSSLPYTVYTAVATTAITAPPATTAPPAATTPSPPSTSAPPPSSTLPPSTTSASPNPSQTPTAAPPSPTPSPPTSAPQTTQPPSPPTTTLAPPPPSPTAAPPVAYQFTFQVQECITEQQTIDQLRQSFADACGVSIDQVTVIAPDTCPKLQKRDIQTYSAVIEKVTAERITAVVEAINTNTLAAAPPALIQGPNSAGAITAIPASASAISISISLLVGALLALLL